MPLHEQPRRIAHQAQSRTLAVLTEIPGFTLGADEPDKCSLRLLDDQASMPSCTVKHLPIVTFGSKLSSLDATAIHGATAEALRSVISSLSVRSLMS